MEKSDFQTYLLENTNEFFKQLSISGFLDTAKKVRSLAIMFSLLRVAVAAFGFLVIRLTEKRVPRIAEKYIHHGNGDCI